MKGNKHYEGEFCNYLTKLYTLPPPIPPLQIPLKDDIPNIKQEMPKVTHHGIIINLQY